MIILAFAGDNCMRQFNTDIGLYFGKARIIEVVASKISAMKCEKMQCRIRNF